MNSMHEIRQWGMRRGVAILTAALLGWTIPAFAFLLPGFTVAYPAGVACEFPLQIDGSGGHLKLLQFVDRFGNSVRMLAAGTGSALTFANLDSGATFTTTSNGSVQRITPNPDGSIEVQNMGHTVVILFDTDTPPGPATTLYAGRVVIRVENGSQFTMVETNGVATDICATLAP